MSDIIRIQTALSLSLSLSHPDPHLYDLKTRQTHGYYREDLDVFKYILAGFRSVSKV